MNHKNSCPVSLSLKGGWSASILPECNCGEEVRKIQEERDKEWWLFLARMEELGTIPKGFCDTGKWYEKLKK